MSDKRTLRTSLLHRRRNLTRDRVRQGSRSVRCRVEALNAWQQADEVMLYLPVNNEVDTWPLAESLWHRKARVLLPCCRPDTPGVMDLACVEDRIHIVSGAYNVPEPDPEVCTLLESAAPPLIIVPGVAFDRRGYRMGYGGGYYDRFLAKPEVRGSLCLGLAYDFQVVETLPRDPWDVPVNILVTESETIWID